MPDGLDKNNIKQISEIYFATSNLHKFEEAQVVFKTNYPKIKLIHFPFSYREIRSESNLEIAEDAVKEAFKRCQKPVFVDDSGLFINALNGFPGTFSAWVFKKLGNEGILALLKDKAAQGNPDRSAYFLSAIAFTDGNSMHLFSGKCEGEIVEHLSGGEGFGYDPIFKPFGTNKTFAESKDLKNNCSHRYKSLLRLSLFLKTGKHDGSE